MSMNETPDKNPDEKEPNEETYTNEEPGQEGEEETKEKSLLGEIWEWTKIILIALLLSTIIRAYIINQTQVISSSMEDTLMTGERFLISKVSYWFSAPEKKDIVVFIHAEPVIRPIFASITPGFMVSFLESMPVYLNRIWIEQEEENYIKRVVAVAGDTIDIKDGHLYVNGEMQDEPYVKGSTYSYGTTFPQTVPPDSLFVMGDNRQDSSDSRVFGPISTDKVIGKSVLRVAPFSKFGKIQ